MQLLMDAYLADPSTSLSSYVGSLPRYLQCLSEAEHWPPRKVLQQNVYFPIGGQVLTPLCSRLNNEHFETTLFLLAADKW